MGDDNIINENKCKWSLADIPVEIFLHICSYLDAPFLVNSLSLVCKRFHEILADETIWRSRIAKRFGSNYPPLPVNDDFDCKIACICIEDQYDNWTRKKYRPILRKDVHYASVDAVHIMQNGQRCVTGSRDRSMVVWDLTEVLNEGTEIPYLIGTDAHKGWIWCLTSSDDKLFSGSWDNTVKSWDFSSSLKQISVFECQTAVLALACKGSFMAAGTFTRTVHLFDTREGNKSIGSYVAHRRCVLALSLLGDFIVSASDDQTLSIWDQRAGKLLKSLALYDTKAGEKEYPLSMSLDKNLLYVGDTKGMLHLLNPNHGLFELAQSYDVGHTNKITCVQHGLGSILTGSTDGTIRISTPTQNPETIFVVQSHGGEVTNFDYKNNILAVGGTDCALELWLPLSDSA